MLEEKAVEAKEPPPSPKGGFSIGKILLVVVLALVSSAGGGVLSFVLIKQALPPVQAAEKAAEKSEKVEQEKFAELLEKSAVLPLEPFVVNLADTDAARYLRIKISLMVDDKTKLKDLAENQALQLKLRDVILESLTAKRSQDLINAEGKNKLRHELQEKVAVYFRAPKLVDGIHYSVMSDTQTALTARTDAMLRELATVYDVSVHITIEVGRLRLRVRDLIRLAPGSIIELKKPAGEPFDICVNGIQVARGEVINVEQSSGVRIVDIPKSGGSTS